MAIWNNNTCNSYRKFYEQNGTTPLNAKGVHNLSYWDQWLLNNGQSLLNKGARSLFLFIDQNSRSSSSSAASTGGAEVIQEHIDTILKKHGVSTIDDLEALVIEKKSLTTEFEKNNNEINKLNNANASLIQRNGELNSFVSSKQAEIARLEAEVLSLQAPAGMAMKSRENRINELKFKIEQYENEIIQKQQEIEQNDKKITENNDEIQRLQDAKTAKQKEIADLEKDIQDLKVYMKQLKKAEGRDAIEELVNEDTGNITDLINKYNRNPENERVKRKLKEALEKYLSDDSIENNNQSIVNYAKFKAKDLGIDSDLINQK